MILTMLWLLPLAVLALIARRIARTNWADLVKIYAWIAVLIYFVCWVMLMLHTVGHA